MPISIDYTVENSTDVNGDFAHALKLFIDEVSGFTVDPGNKLLVAYTAPDGVDYHYRVAMCSDLYNYAEDSADTVSPYFLRGFLHRKFEHGYQVAEFIESVDNHLSYFATDWEALQTASASLSTESFTGGSLDISTKTVTSANAVQEGGGEVKYYLTTVSATVDGETSYPGFLLSEDAASLERVVRYRDLETAFEGDDGNERLSGITFCVDSEDKKDRIISALSTDFERLYTSLTYMPAAASPSPVPSPSVSPSPDVSTGTVRIVNYAIDKKIYPPIKTNSPRFLTGDFTVLKQGFTPNGAADIQTTYPGILSPENTE